jgi:uncharacterized protein YuzE
MKTNYDSSSDALYVRFGDAAIVESEEVADGVVLDFDAEGRIVAIEVLEASKHLSAAFNSQRQRSDCKPSPQ